MTRAKLDALEARLQALGIDLARVTEEGVRAGGPGGQHVNKTSTGVRLAYEWGSETLQVKYTRERSRGLNRFFALRELAEDVASRVAPDLNLRRAEIERVRRGKARKRRRSAAKRAAPPGEPSAE